jgi:hypothetical protein
VGPVTTSHPVYLCVRQHFDSRVPLALVVFALAFHLVPKGLFHRCEHALASGTEMGLEAMLSEVCAVCDIALPGPDAVPGVLITAPTSTATALFMPFTEFSVTGIAILSQVRGPPGMI